MEYLEDVNLPLSKSQLLYRLQEYQDNHNISNEKPSECAWNFLDQVLTVSSSPEMPLPSFKLYVLHRPSRDLR